jgi:hypothetical protein
MTFATREHVIKSFLPEKNEVKNGPNFARNWFVVNSMNELLWKLVEIEGPFQIKSERDDMMVAVSHSFVFRYV